MKTDTTAEEQARVEEIIKETPPKIKTFPYWPPTPTDTMMHRTELMHQLNMWENNNPEVAKEVAQTLINLISKQFDLHEKGKFIYSNRATDAKRMLQQETTDHASESEIPGSLPDRQ